MLARDKRWEREFPGVTYLIFMPRQVHGEVAIPRIPDLEGAVFAACDEQPAVCGPRALINLQLNVRRCRLIEQPCVRRKNLPAQRDL